MLIAGLAVIAGSALWLALNAAGEIRYTADHSGTRPMWHIWIPILAGLALARLTPAPPPPAAGLPVKRGLRLQAGVLLAAAVLFAVALRLVTAGGHNPEPAHTLLKLLLLVALPLLLFRLSRADSADRKPVVVRDRAPALLRLAPVLPVAAWFVLAHFGPFARPYGDWTAGLDLVTILITMITVFAVNALLEEVFYRRWLQTRWERLIGPWPAIVLAGLAFAAWHVGIQGSGGGSGPGHLGADLASAFVNQGVLGLFLGYLWTRYRLMWPILTVHGAINAAPALLALL